MSCHARAVHGRLRRIPPPQTAQPAALSTPGSGVAGGRSGRHSPRLPCVATRWAVAVTVAVAGGGRFERRRRRCRRHPLLGRCAGAPRASCCGSTATRNGRSPRTGRCGRRLPPERSPPRFCLGHKGSGAHGRGHRRVGGTRCRSQPPPSRRRLFLCRRCCCRRCGRHHCRRRCRRRRHHCCCYRRCDSTAASHWWLPLVATPAVAALAASDGENGAGDGGRRWCRSRRQRQRRLRAGAAVAASAAAAAVAGASGAHK